MPRIKYPDFSRGELSPSVYGNSRLTVSQSGCRQLVNAWTTAKGAVIKRNGTEYLAVAPIWNKKPKLVPFKYSTTQKYELVFQEGKCHIIKDGGFVLVPQATIEPANTKIESRSTGELRLDVSLTTAGVHGLAVGDVVYIADNTPSAFAAARRRYYKVKTVVSTSVVDLNERDSTNPSLGTIAATADVTYGKLAYFAHPWTESQLFSGAIDFDQSNDVLHVTHNAHRTRLITRTDHHLWTVSNFSATPEEPPVAGLTDTAAPSGVLTIKYAVTAINDTTKEESLASIHIIENTDEPTRGSPDDPISLEWTKNTNATAYRVYRAINGIFGLLDEARWDAGLTVTYSDFGDRVPLLEIGPPISVETPFDTTGNYPRAVALFQQRIWFAGTDLDINGIFASRSGSFRSFAQEEVVVDSSPIAQVVASGVQEIRYMLALRDLVIFTERGEWTFDKGDQGIITPSSGLISQGDWGCANVKPVKVGRGAIFVEQSGRMVRDIAYDISADGLDGIDLSAASDHLFDDASIVAACYARKPYKVFFAVLSNGNAVALTYDKEQESFGWSRFETAGQVIDCIAARDGDVDNIYLSVKRGAEYFIERLNMRETKTIHGNQYLDCWMTRPSSQYDYKSAAISAMRDDPNDGYKWKLKIGSGDIVQKWPFVLDLFPDAATLFPGVDGGSFMLTLDPNPPESGTWYVINRFIGGAPTWSTETVDANVALYPLFTPKLERGQSYRSIGVAAGNIFYGTGEIANVPNLPVAATQRGRVFPAFRGDYDYFDVSELGVWGTTFTSLNGDKVYANICFGYPYSTTIEPMEVDPADQSLDGKPIKTASAVVRVNNSWDFTIERASQDQAASTIRLIDRCRDRFDRQRGLIVNAHAMTPTLSKWDTQSSLIIRSTKPYPLTVQAIAMEVEIDD